MEYEKRWLEKGQPRAKQKPKGSPRKDEKRRTQDRIMKNETRKNENGEGEARTCLGTKKKSIQKKFFSRDDNF